MGWRRACLVLIWMTQRTPKWTSTAYLQEDVDEDVHVNGHFLNLHTRKYILTVCITKLASYSFMVDFLNYSQVNTFSFLKEELSLLVNYNSNEYLFKLCSTADKYEYSACCGVRVFSNHGIVKVSSIASASYSARNSCAKCLPRVVRDYSVCKLF